jgi:HK97 family phage major capsid protein
MNLQQLETAVQEAKDNARDLYVSINRRTFSESRAMTAAENEQVHAAIQRTNGLQEQLTRARSNESRTDAFARFEEGMGLEQGVSGTSVGAQFIRSGAGKWLQSTKHQRLGQWWSPNFELHATTITENPASGGALVAPDYRPTIAPLPLPRLRVADLFSDGTTNSNAVSYPQEKSFTNAAAMVAEGAAKPESAIAWSLQSDKVEKVAHWIPVSEEIVDDSPALMSFINMRLTSGVVLTESDQLLNGDGITPNLLGLLRRTGLAADIPRVDPETNADVIARQIAAIETNTDYEVTGIVMHPTNWLKIQLSKDTTGAYLAGSGPFAASPTPTLWGRPVAQTKSIALGTALVVCERAAMVIRRTGISIAVTNSHQNFFVLNLLAIRCEERLTLAVMAPGALGTVSNLN